MFKVILGRGSRVQTCVCQRECWYTTVLHLQWSLLKKELSVHMEQDSCAAACVLCLPVGTGDGLGHVPCATASLQEPNAWSEATSVVGASTCSFPDPALSSCVLCPQHQMAGQSLFQMVTACLEAGLIHSAASQWLGISPAIFA